MAVTSQHIDPNTVDYAILSLLPLTLDVSAWECEGLFETHVIECLLPCIIEFQ